MKLSTLGTPSIVNILFHEGVKGAELWQFFLSSLPATNFRPFIATNFFGPIAKVILSSITRTINAR